MQAGNGLMCLDLQFQGMPGVIASWLMPTDSGWVIIDCGPATTIPVLERAVVDAGLEMGDINRIVLTHIHLDHAGGSGALLQKHPHLRVTVHRDSAGILVDPSRLIRSATISYGEAMQSLWGDIVPVDPDRIDAISPGEPVPGTALCSIATPGHTATHLAYIHERTGILFTGDAAHARLQGSAVIVPTLSPVEVDVEAWSATANVMEALNPTALALPHFGMVTDAVDHLGRIEERIRSRIDLAQQIVRSPGDMQALADALASTTRAEYETEGGDIETKVATMEWCMPSWLGAQGIMRWFKVHDMFPNPA